MNATLGEFARGHQQIRPTPSSRATALLLTALLFAGFALIVSQRASVPDRAILQVTVLNLAPAPPHREPPLPRITAHLLAPHSETVATPRFTIATETALATLPAPAANPSSPDAGSGTGTGTGTRTASADGGAAACLDAAWMRAVTDHVRRYFYQPRSPDREPIAGLVYVHFIVAHDGTLLETSISKTTGQRSLNDAALDIMRLAAPLPAIPDRMHTQQVEGILPMAFGGLDQSVKPSAGHCAG
jgi:TonB family protein